MLDHVYMPPDSRDSGAGRGDIPSSHSEPGLSAVEGGNDQDSATLPRTELRNTESIDMWKVFHIVSQLCGISRTGWVNVHVSEPENVSAHSYGVALMVFLVANRMRNIDVDKILGMALLHDLGEVKAGDRVWYGGRWADRSIRETRTAVERELIQEISANLRDNSILELWEEYEAMKTPEAQLVKEIDMLDMVSTAFHYEELEPHIDFQEFWDSIRGKIRTPFLTKIHDTLQKRRIKNQNVKPLASATEAMIRVIRYINFLKSTEHVASKALGITSLDHEADHIYRVAMMSFFLTNHLGVRRDKLVKLALIQGLAKAHLCSRSEGITTLSTTDGAVQEKENGDAFYKQLAQDLSDDSIFSLWQDLKRRRSAEAKILYQIEKLDAVIAALEYEKAGGVNLQVLWDDADERIKASYLRTIFESAKRQRPALSVLREGQQRLFEKLSSTDPEVVRRAWKDLQEWRNPAIPEINLKASFTSEHEQIVVEQLKGPEVFSEFTFASPKTYDSTVASFVLNGIQLFFRKKRNGHIFMDPMPGPEYFRRYYDDTYATCYLQYNYFSQEPKKRKSARRILGFISQKVEKTGVNLDRMRVLEVGAGAGYLLDEGRNKYQWLPEAIEMVPVFIGHLEDLSISVHRGIFEQLKFDAPRYDMVILKDVLEHLPTSEGSLGKVHRVLNLEGIVYIEVPIMDKYGVRFGLLEHVQGFSRKSIQEILEKHGFKILGIEIVEGMNGPHPYQEVKIVASKLGPN